MALKAEAFLKNFLEYWMRFDACVPLGRAVVAEQLPPQKGTSSSMGVSQAAQQHVGRV